MAPFFVVLSSCATVTLVNDRKGIKPGKTKSFTAFEHAPFFFSMQNQAVEISRFCPKAWKSVTASQPFYASWVSAGTFGYYRPYRVTMKCGRRK